MPSSRARSSSTPSFGAARRLCRRALRATLAGAVVAALLPDVAWAQIPLREYAERRGALAARLPGDGVILAMGAPEPEHDYLPFNQTSPFRYLTGFDEPGAAMLLVRRGAAVTGTLFVQPSVAAQEVWVGRRAGVAGAERVTGLTGRDAAQLRATLDSSLRAGTPLYIVGAAPTPGAPLSAHAQMLASITARHPGARVSYVGDQVDGLRGTKSAAELDLIRKAVAITVDAQRAAMATLRPGLNEFEVQALIEYTFRRNGAERPSFATIVGSGPNATTLHYNADDRFIEAGDMVVMDIGASYRGYAADVTRTLPAGGTFSPEQRAVYQIVRDAQAAAERQATPGADAGRMTDSANVVIAAGLARLGLVESATATYDCDAEGTRQCAQYRLFFMHGLGHGIGLDVHDPEQYYFTGRLAAGSAFTIEPGIYVRADVLDVLPQTSRNAAMASALRARVAQYTNIGVRIEDDYLVTDKGLEWISQAPREIAEIEALMAKPRAATVFPRDSTKVEWYRRTGR